MMLRPVVRETVRPNNQHAVTRDSFIADLTPAERHAAKRCESVRPLAVVAPDVWLGLKDML